jgi:hypothetical protein
MEQIPGTPETAELRLTTEEFRAVGFMPGYTKFDAAECQMLNAELAVRLQGHKPFSPDWYQVARDFHNFAKSWLRCCCG